MTMMLVGDDGKSMKEVKLERREENAEEWQSRQPKTRENKVYLKHSLDLMEF